MKCHSNALMISDTFMNMVEHLTPVDIIKFEVATSRHSCGSLHTRATIFINSVVYHQFRRVRNRYFNSDGWETTIVVRNKMLWLISSGKVPVASLISCWNLFWECHPMVSKQILNSKYFFTNKVYWQTLLTDITDNPLPNVLHHQLPVFQWRHCIGCFSRVSNCFWRHRNVLNSFSSTCFFQI